MSHVFFDTKQNKELIVTSTLAAFCREQNLCYVNMNAVKNGRQHAHKGIVNLGEVFVDKRKEAGKLRAIKLSLIGEKKFICDANNKFGYKFDYSKVKYINSHTKVIIICPIHGEFSQTPTNHLKASHGCERCYQTTPKTVTQEEFIDKAVKMHNNLYDYSLVDYKGSSNFINIICTTHGIFKQRAQSHSRGEGCPECAKLSRGWGKSEYVQKLKSRGITKAKLYIIKLYNHEEEFIKIGITSKSIKYRFNNFKYSYETIGFYEDDAGAIWSLEKLLFKMLREFKYKPNQSFAGDTECFTRDILNILL